HPRAPGLGCLKCQGGQAPPSGTGPLIGMPGASRAQVCHAAMGPDVDELKRAAARRALELVVPGMTLGLGTGTTAKFFIEGLRGLRVAAVATSIASAELARAAGVELLDDPPGPLDLAVDGADEIDPALRLVKGHGGALFREKLVAAAAR